MFIIFDYSISNF